MSWNLSVSGPKADISRLIDEAVPSPTAIDEHMSAQVPVAKVAAKLIAANIPGPHLYVSIGGHANGVGEQEKPGWGNDFISVQVTQFFPKAA